MEHFLLPQFVISFKNENIQVLHSKTFAYVNDLQQLDMSGNPISFRIRYIC